MATQGRGVTWSQSWGGNIYISQSLSRPHLEHHLGLEDITGADGLEELQQEFVVGRVPRVAQPDGQAGGVVPGGPGVVKQNTAVAA